MCEVACPIHHRHSRSDSPHQYGVLHVHTCEVACLVHHRHSRSDSRHQYGVLHVSKAFLIYHLEEKKSGLEVHGKMSVAFP